MFNINGNIINCVLIGLIIIIIIIVINNMLKVNLEYKNKCPINKNVKKEIISLDNKILVSPINTVEKIKINSESESSESDSESKSELYKSVRKDLISPPPTICNSDEIENMDHRLMRDIVIGRKYQQGESQEDFSKKEINDYFIDYQDFDNKINNSSRNTCDVVARIAEEKTSHNSELTHQQGQTIGEVFDGITKDQLDSMKQCKNSGCVQPGKFDDLTQRDFYNDNNSPAYSMYHTKYETDNVNNGGKFYNNIEGNDSNFFFEMKIKE
jgi:hypothetical protein